MSLTDSHSKISLRNLLGVWEGEFLADDLFVFRLHINKRKLFELLDVENGELVMGEYSVEYKHGIWFIALNMITEVQVFQWDGKAELKNNSFIFLEKMQNQKNYFLFLHICTFR